MIGTSGAESTSPQKRSYFDWIGLALIIVLGAILRFGWMGVTSFAFDEARLSLISLNMAQNGQFAFLGMPSSVGVPNLPAAAWIFAIPYALSTDPQFASAFAGLCSLLGVIGVWWLVRHAWGSWAALTAALFLATAPFSVLYSRSVWAQNLLPPLAVAWAATAYIAIIRQNRYALALHIFLAGFIFQVHFAGIALILGTLYFFVRFRWWRQLIAVVIGGAVALVTLMPFGLHVACCALQVAEQFGSALGGASQFDLLSVQETTRLAVNWNWGYLAAGDWPLPVEPLITVALTVIILLAGLAAVLTRLSPSIVNQRQKVLAEITLVWLIVSPLFFIRHSTPVFIHYQLASLPAIALIAGGSVLLVKQRWWPPLLAGVMLLTAILWSVQIGSSLAEAGQVEHGGGLGTPLSITSQVANAVPDDLPVLFFTHGNDPDLDGEVAVFKTLWWGRDHRIVQGESLLILPPYPAYLLATLAPFQAWEEIEAAGLAQTVDEFPRREGEGPGFIGTRYDGETSPDGFTLLDTPVLFSHGSQLEGWKARMVGPRLRISTLWQVIEAPTSGTYQQFHHLRTSETLEGEPFMVADVPVTAHNWRIGDQLIVMGDFFVDDYPEYWVDIGQYTLPDIQRVPLAAAEGDSYRLGPFRIQPNP